jgi:hypothetical protein
MKKLLLAGLLLAGCSKNDPDPTPALTGDTWTLQSEVTQATEVNSGSSTTIPVATAGQVMMRYKDDTHYTLDVQEAVGSRRHFESTYSLRGQTLAYTAIYSWHTGLVVPRTVQVTELSSHKVEKYDFTDTWSGTTHYVTTYMFSR